MGPAGLKPPGRSDSATSRRAVSADSPSGTEGQSPTSPVEGSLSQGTVPLHTRQNSERRLRDQQFAQEAQDTQASLRKAPDAGSASKTPSQSSLQRVSHAEGHDADAAEQQKGASLSRYLLTSQQVASALAASRAQLHEMGPPLSPEHHAHSPDQEQCIQELKDRVS